MVRRLGTAAAVAGLAGSLAFSAAPAHATELCDPNGFVCLYVLDARNDCPGGYQRIARVPDPTGGVVLLVCVLR